MGFSQFPQPLRDRGSARPTLDGVVWYIEINAGPEGKASRQRMATIQVDLPEELLQAARISAQPSMSASASREVAKLLALELFCKGAVSLGLAAKLCGVPQAEFMQFAAEREVALRYSLEDLEQDHQFIESLSS